MKIVQLIQGTPEWHAHRAQHLNASDAPAMLGCSPYKSRSQLLREIATGVPADIDSETQRRMDAGHRAEALARPIAEQIVGEDLFPCVGVADHGPYSASFDGLTLMEDTAFEHKSLNDDLRDVFADIDTMHPKYRETESAGRLLPKHYRVQMEQQLMVSGAERVLFMASKWNNDGSLVEERHCRYYSDPALRAEIIAGWEQFAADVAAYQPEPAAAPSAVGRAPETLPALRVEVTGMVTASNLAEFKSQAMTVLGTINRDLQTDEDFANAEQTVKWCKGVEERLAATKDQVLSQTADIERVFRTMDEVAAETRRIRLELDKLVTREKEARRAEIVNAGVTAVRQHYSIINATLGEHALGVPASLASDMGAAIKGKKSLSSMRDAIASAAAAAKIAASQHAELVRANIAIITAQPDDLQMLFADRVLLCGTKAPDDLRNLVAARIAEHQQREAERLARQRQQQESKAVEASAAAEAATSAPAAPAPITVVQTGAAPMPAGARLKLGDINAWIAPLSITADGLASLGFKPVGTERAAKLYAANDFPRICHALEQVVAQAPARASSKEAA
ncbi:lambda-exonuclease family protein [Lysobacter fragariae]